MATQDYLKLTPEEKLVVVEKQYEDLVNDYNLLTAKCNRLGKQLDRLEAEKAETTV